MKNIFDILEEQYKDNIVVETLEEEEFIIDSTYEYPNILTI